jgi:hypothetical protein
VLWSYLVRKPKTTHKTAAAAGAAAKHVEAIPPDDALPAK